MKLLPLLMTCLRALVRNPMRAALTILGIIIGIASVVAIMEIGEGSKKQIKEQIASIGADTVIIRPASITKAGVNTGMGGRASIYPEDSDAIQEECRETVLLSSPVVRASGQIVVGNQNWSPGEIAGGNENYFKINSWSIDKGRFYNKKDVESSARVCLIGQTIAKELFADEDPVGKDLRIKDVAFTVIGVLAGKGSGMMGDDQDDVVLLPWTSIRSRLKGSSNEATISAPTSSQSTSEYSSYSTFASSEVNFYPGADLQPYTNTPHPLRFRTVDMIAVQIRNKEDANPAMDEMTKVLRRRHGLVVGELDDFSMFDRAQISKMVTSTSETMSGLLLAVAMISLVVGGVGIMNIMMVSVTERTREIGLRMAVGARPRDIMWQFLLEAVLLCMAGGFLGIGLGRCVSAVVSAKMGWPVSTSPGAMALSVAVAATIGIIFGWYPAHKASQLDPIDALRHE